MSNNSFIGGMGNGWANFWPGYAGVPAPTPDPPSDPPAAPKGSQAITLGSNQQQSFLDCEHQWVVRCGGWARTSPWAPGPGLKTDGAKFFRDTLSLYEKELTAAGGDVKAELRRLAWQAVNNP